METIPSSIKEAVLVKTRAVDQMTTINGKQTILESFPTQVKGYDFNQGINHSALLQTYLTTGFQATSFGQSVLQIEQMVG